MMMHCGRTLAIVAIASFAFLGCDSTSPLVATHVIFDSQPPATAVSAQTLGSIRVTVLTAAGQIATGTNYQVTISLLASDTAAHLAGTTSVQTTDGVATFSDLSVARAGSDFRLVASVADLGSWMSQPFTVKPGPPSKLQFDSSQPSLSFQVGSDIPAVVRVTDAAGNTVPDATNSVTVGDTRTGSIGMTVAPDSLFGPVTQPAVNGVATFSGLSIHKSGLYSLSATSAGLAAATSGQLTMMAGPMAKLIFVTQPSDGTASTPLATFSVQQVDVYGNGMSLPPGPPYSVTISLGNNPGGAALGGTLTAQGFGSLAMTFGNVSIDKPGTGYTLVATSDGRTVTSAAFSIH